MRTWIVTGDADFINLQEHTLKLK